MCFSAYWSRWSLPLSLLHVWLSNARAQKMTFSVEEGYFLVNGPWAFSHWNFWSSPLMSWTPLGLKLCFLSLVLFLILPRGPETAELCHQHYLPVLDTSLTTLLPQYMPGPPSISITDIYYAPFITTLSCPLQLFLHEYFDVSSSNLCNMSNLSAIFMLELLFIWKSSHWSHLIFFRCFVLRKSTTSDTERLRHFSLGFFF